MVSIPYHRPQSYYDQAAWRDTWAEDGGGVLMGDPLEVQTQAATLERRIAVEDMLAATLRFAGGARGPPAPR